MEMNSGKTFKSMNIIGNIKSPILSCFILFFLVLIILAANLTLEIDLSKTEDVFNGIPIRKIFSMFPLDSTRVDERHKVPGAKPIVLAPPRNVSRKGRIKWLLQHLSEFDILRPSNLSQKFHGRVLEFLIDDCEANFFMTWVSPVELFGPREFSCVESVFKAHPRGCLTILSSRMDSPAGYLALKPLIDRGFRILAVTPNLPFLLENTPAKAWLEKMKAGKADPGKIPLSQNLSNLMRLVVLYKYGGIYLDTDVIVLKSFKDLKNSIGAQSVDTDSHWTRLNNAVLIFDKKHPLLLKFIEEFASTFNGNRWGHNGPYLVTRVIQRLREGDGYEFSVLPPWGFYSVNWLEIQKLFKVPGNLNDSRWVESRVEELEKTSYGLHLWNKFSRKFQIQPGSAMERLFSRNCILCRRIPR